MQPEDKNIKKRISEWLETQGYPLELEVSQAFQKEGFTVSISDWYKDFESEEMREIDVSAVKWSDISKNQSLQVCFRVECKAAHDKPWIVFISKSQDNKYIPFNFLLTDEYRYFLTEILTKNEAVRLQIKDLPLLTSYPAGHSITQAFTTGQDIPYKAVMSSLKASVDRITGLQKLTNQKPLPGNNANKFWGIVFPVIVVDGLLFECSISDEGTIAIGETDISVLHWKGQLPIPSSPDIFIVTKRSIDGFVRLASKTADGLIDTVPK